jgi:SagB-type dehydrogenase family enzyme
MKGRPASKFDEEGPVGRGIIPARLYWANPKQGRDMENLQDKLNTVYSYHDETKHHFQRYARSLGFLDWTSQPDPFRQFDGTEITRLEIPDPGDQPTWDALFSPGPEPTSVSPASLSEFFYSSLALSAWKQVVSPAGEVVSRWALRVNPSSGNLHPTEGYLVNADGVFHYAPREHQLEKRAAFGPGIWDDFASNLPSDAFLVGLTSIHWREAWKYGERAFRYCQHDVGHALAALTLAAKCQGWQTRLLDGPQTRDIEKLLGVDGQIGSEKEHGDCLVVVWPDKKPHNITFAGLPEAGDWAGAPNSLSEKHQDWPILSEVAAATPWPGRTKSPAGNITKSQNYGTERGLSAHQLIRGRRSAVAMDGESSMSRADFFGLLERLLPTADHPVFSAVPNLANVSLGIFVHRVEDLTPGLYVLVRHPEHEESLRESFRDDFSWERPEACPEHLPLFVLGHGDLRDSARQLSCGQAIAADGAFSLGMLARFDHALDKEGPGMYPRLFWETGMIGQMLYLEGEAAGTRGTGIGCFFDDEVHRVLGIADHSWQSLYHFTVGGAVDDERLQSVPAYTK